MSNNPAMQSLEQPGFPIRLALILLLLSIGIAVSGLLYYREQKGVIERQCRNELCAIADLKAGQVESWRRERLADGDDIRENPLIMQAIARLLTGPRSDSSERAVAAWMTEYQQRHVYSNVTLLDSHNVVRLTGSAAIPPVDPEKLASLAVALNSRSVVLSDVHRDAAGFDTIQICIPISRSDPARPPGALMIEIDPRHILCPLIAKWPSGGRSSAAILLSRQGGHVLYLNASPDANHEIPRSRVPAANTVLAFVKPGPGAFAEIRDDRGPAVIAARAIPDSSWILIARMDREEIYGRLRRSALSTAFSGFLLFLAAAAGILLLWREQQGRLYRQLQREHLEHQALLERLDVLSRYANDIILLSDPLGQIVDANERAVLSYGYQLQELTAFKMTDLLAPEARPDFERLWDRLMEEGVLIGEACHQRKDKSTFPVQISARLLAFGGNMCCQVVIRDISERKAALKQLRLFEAAMLQTADGIVISEVCGSFPCRPHPVFVNAAFERLTGYNQEDLRREPDLLLCGTAPGPTGRPCAEFGQCPSQVERIAARKDGSRFHAEWNMNPLLDESGSPSHCVFTCRDVTERKRAEESAQFLSSVVESSNDAIIGKDMNGIVASWNQGAERIFGYSAAEMIGRPISILAPPERPCEFSDIMTFLRHGQSIEHFETERVRKDGRRISVSLTISPLKNRANQMIGASIVARDITERKRAAEQLLEAHRKTSTILDSISDGFVALDSAWCYVYVNPSAGRLLGWPPEQLLGRNLWELWPYAAESDFGIAFRRALADNTHVRFEAFYPEPLNRWFETRCYPASDGLMLFFTDTTDRKDAERALRLSEQRYRSLALVTAQIVWTTNPEGEVFDDMRSWCEFTGQTAHQIQGRGWLDALHPEDRGHADEVWARAVETRSFYVTEYRMRRNDGEYRWMSVHGVPVLENAGVIREWVGTCADITDRKQFEQEIQNLNQKLEQRVLERTAQLRDANRELEAFAYSVSHDLRAPLRAVDGFSRILLEEYAPELSPGARYYVELASRNAQQMGALIDGLLKFSRLSRQPLCKQLIAPASLVRQVWDELRRDQNGREIDLRVSDMEPCRGDALLLKQVFVNLISNALKYSRARDIARIDIGSMHIADVASPVYFVRDNGVGFDSRYCHKLFGVFQRLHRAEDYEGTGVGLATVQRIVQRHGGRVWAESILDQGATFYFTLAANSPQENDEHGR